MMRTVSGVKLNQILPKSSGILRFEGRKLKQSIQPDLFSPHRPDVKGLNRFAVIGDAGSGKKAQWDIARQMLNVYQNHDKPFASVLVLGDNVYEDGEPHLFYERIYEPYKKLFKQHIRFYPVMGNHDVRKDFGDKQLAYWGAPAYYNFTQGPVEFFALDTTVLLPGYEKCHAQNPFLAQTQAKIQMTWLEKALQDSKAKFKVVYGHYPLYSSGKHALDKESTLKLRSMLEPLFKKYGVHLYLAGHDHHYERTLIDKVHYFVSGAAGKLRKIFFQNPVQHREKALEKHHFMLFELDKDQLKYEVISRKGTVLDSGVVGPTSATQLSA